ncbi:hypothetical protein LOTGIDRAFT_228500 [Lottia gigantea]|uniref:MD-2-related lipid-recognition domain-containing protein n=1 Tax=Lottia gigantea TaxID=225164 RepID=V3ZQK7_LOTGI|nr:hypothetical protein LOTGIDRAFT_228500 [Lottia gigantea]ESO93688.1 hypothetical protein LOTGIDRAFT_228500 [Lottia gigantea]
MGNLKIKIVLACLCIFTLATADILKYLPKDELKKIDDAIGINGDISGFLKSLLNPSRFKKVDAHPPKESVIYSGKIRTSFGQVGHFSLKNCGDKSKEVFSLTYLSITPDPLVFPGQLTVSFTGTAHKNIQSPVNANVTLKNSKTGVYPCVANIGSCDYNDLCAMLELIQVCPPPLTSAGIPCKCPINEGNYKLKEASFDVEAVVLPPGDYMAQANMTSGTDLIGCYQVYVSFA